MNNSIEFLNPDADDAIDDEIFSCLNPDEPRSFFLYAGAGSGKTHSLSLALKRIRKAYGERLRVRGKKIAVITFTNAASDEIASRIDLDPLFTIKTLHSFCWQIIKPLQADIQQWLLAQLPDEIVELERLEEKGRAGTAASIARLKSIEAKKKELEQLSKPRKFNYNPNGDNTGDGALSHADVIKIASHFLENKPSVQQILVNNYPLVFIDESQDTNKNLIAALLAVEVEKRGTFALGLIGDMMQRIYSDGLATLAPPRDGGWATPQKKLNRRSPRRVVELGNALRVGIDDIVQHPIDGAGDGVIRLFVVEAQSQNKAELERHVRTQMAEITGDNSWNNIDSVKQLMLEHSMAAERMGFAPMFNALRRDKRRSTSLMQGSLPAVKFFSDKIMTLWELWREDRSFQIMSHLAAANSPLLNLCTARSKRETDTPLQPLSEAIKTCCEYLDDKPDATFGEVLNVFGGSQLFLVPKSLAVFVGVEEIVEDELAEEGDDLADDSQVSAIAEFLETPFSQIKAYTDYILGDAAFDTHQGVKGLEFDHVQVVIDDAAARGFLFSYERLFDVKPASKREQQAMEDGTETSIHRTSRLLYVTCTRAKKSLAVVAYTEDKSRLAEHAMNNGWFHEDEIIILR